MGTRVDDLFLQVRGATGPNNVAQRRRQRPVVRSVVGVCREVYSHVNAIYAQRPSVPCNMGDKGSTASGANTWPSSSVTFNAAKKRFRSNRRAAAAKWPQLHRRRRGCALKRHGEEPINSLANRDCFRALACELARAPTRRARRAESPTQDEPNNSGNDAAVEASRARIMCARWLGNKLRKTHTHSGPLAYKLGTRCPEQPRRLHPPIQRNGR